jgi:hypothetical protein
MPTATDLVTDLPADFEVFGQAVDTRLKALQPGTTLGDLAYSSATANTNTRLPIGTAGQVLAVSGGVPAWTTTSDVTPLTTKGDLFTFTTVDARIGVGANGTILTADSAEATGMKWASPTTPTSGLNLISTTNLSASGNFNINGCFSATYDNYFVTFSNMTGSTANTIEFGLRIGSSNATGTDYKNAGYYMLYTSTTIVGGVSNGIGRMATLDPGTSSTQNAAATLFLSAPFKTTNTGFDLDAQVFDAIAKRSGVHSLATSYDSMWFTVSTGTVTGNISIYGLAK